ncbi:transglycosylase domain-containing protein, partial [Brachybacterium paraconglomeratum]|nr:transglycosylase domain-containing protein [Brachybacterium paraconglomeratum]
LTQAGGGNLAVARLEPLLIGGLYPAHQEDRVLIKLEQVPPYLVETLVAIEDREFFNHFGVSPKGIARAVWINATAGQLRQGG